MIGDPLEFSEYYGKKMTEEEMASVDERLREYMLEMRKNHEEFLANNKKKNKKAD